MPGVEFLAPTSLDEATGALGGDDTHLVGGGTALTLLVKTGLVHPARLVWLGRVAELRNLSVEGGWLRIGGGVTLHTLATAAVVRRHCPALAAAAGQAANIRVRAVATLGGHLAHADPRQDCPPVLLALGARVHLRSATRARAVALDDLLVSLMETAIGPEEVVTAVEVPLDSARREAYVRFAPGSADDFPTVGAAAAVRTGEGGVLQSVQVGVGGAGPRATLHAPDPSRWAGRPLTAEVARALATAVAAKCEPAGDHRGSARYRRHVTAVTVERALIRAGTAPGASSGA